jgi:hypothetical protein
VASGGLSDGLRRFVFIIHLVLIIYFLMGVIAGGGPSHV